MYAAVKYFAQHTCPNYETKELPSEAQQRVRRAKAANPQTQATSTKKPRHFTGHTTYKYHSLGDYADYIERSGPTDNYNTQVVNPSKHFLPY